VYIRRVRKMNEAFLEAIRGGLDKLYVDRRKLQGQRFDNEDDEYLNEQLKDINDEIRRLEQYRRDHGK
jgi:hypothetical protein